ncbi:flavin reductase [Actinomadura sp. LD22]|uniref:Flavin reductase n=1 Tax=Actinomadura physcomitrii TaxID=2650748 RepID=A0A6I4MGQ5_9ACTN|nr:flavin reductase family protein [Actinomadura physcomitrii]MWA03187.1 flavin reductase [Actinomadura physcomitrii]
MDAATFRAALSRFASGVVIVSTRAGDGRAHGFTATAFTSVSADPPLVLTCLDTTARCHAVFERADLFAIDVLRPHHWPLAKRFASKVDDKFGADFGADAWGLPRLPDALTHLSCRTAERITAGDHTVLFGLVMDADVDEGEPTVFFDRAARRIAGSLT